MVQHRHKGTSHTARGDCPAFYEAKSKADIILQHVGGGTGHLKPAVMAEFALSTATSQ